MEKQATGRYLLYTKSRECINNPPSLPIFKVNWGEILRLGLQKMYDVTIVYHAYYVIFLRVFLLGKRSVFPFTAQCVIHSKSMSKQRIAKTVEVQKVKEVEPQGMRYRSCDAFIFFVSWPYPFLQLADSLFYNSVFPHRITNKWLDHGGKH